MALPEPTPAIKRLILINAAVFVANAVLAGRLSDGLRDEPMSHGWFACSWPLLWDGYGLGLLRLVSYQFTHSFQDPWHVLWNMLTLYFFGPMAERSLGHRGVYKLYLLGGVVAAMAHIAVVAAGGHPGVAVVGASGACSAFLLYAACIAPRSRVILVVVPVMLWVLAALVLFIGVYGMYVEFVTGYPGGTAHGAHVGGALFGLLAYRCRWFRDLTPYAYQNSLFGSLGTRLRRWRARSQQRAAAGMQQQVDEVLEKVHRSGLSSLSGAERRVLERESERSKKR
ncbi:MAG TPA: rhomboid family intramembrane serine protease [Planctomycetota bacterium]|nr:rhomboid family intramembrane serine protease [Planctomycetota bacterium]